jgi:hypothetical protein
MPQSAESQWSFLSNGYRHQNIGRGAIILPVLSKTQLLIQRGANSNIELQFPRSHRVYFLVAIPIHGHRSCRQTPDVVQLT